MAGRVTVGRPGCVTFFINAMATPPIFVCFLGADFDSDMEKL